jgi:hypothetical protein
MPHIIWHFAQRGYKKARRDYNGIAHATKHQKRLHFYAAALDLIRNSRITPETVVKEDDQHT